MALPIKRRNEKVLRPLRPNVGTEAEYRRKLLDLIERMHISVKYWLEAAYRANEPEVMALDAKGDFKSILTKLHDDAKVSALKIARVTLPSGAILIESTEGKAREYRIILPGQLFSKRISKGDLANLIEAEEKIERISVRQPPLPPPEPTPAAKLNESVSALGTRWQNKFDEMAPKLADYFATDVTERSDATLKNALKKGGFAIKFKMTPAMADIVDATVNENVNLIRSIPQQYLNRVQGMVMRSVRRGRAIGELAAELEKEFGVTKRRAALIARDQNNKATSALTHARQLSLGITHGIWRHSGAGKEPRPKHVAAHGRKYDLRKGLPIGDKGKYVLPGEEINCRCTSQPVIPGF